MTKLVTIFGGSGFVGRYIARRMAKEGWRVRVAVRRPNEAIFPSLINTAPSLWCRTASSIGTANGSAAKLNVCPKSNVVSVISGSFLPDGRSMSVECP